MKPFPPAEDLVLPLQQLAMSSALRVVALPHFVRNLRPGARYRWWPGATIGSAITPTPNDFARSPLEHAARHGQPGLPETLHPPHVGDEEPFPCFRKFRPLEAKRFPVPFYCWVLPDPVWVTPRFRDDG